MPHYRPVIHSQILTNGFLKAIYTASFVSWFLICFCILQLESIQIVVNVIHGDFIENIRLRGLHMRHAQRPKEKGVSCTSVESSKRE